jgi:predicted enzyme related to lactoylglutathione lyase
MSSRTTAGRPDMDVELFAIVSVTDFDRAIAWYERLLGTPSTFTAHDTEQVWTVAEHGSIAVHLEAEHAGHAQVVLFVDDLDGFVEAAGGRGITETSRETYDNGVRKVLFHDPDGNEVGVGGAPVGTPAD